MTIDLTPVWQAAVSLAALTLGTFGSLALNRLAQRFHIQIKADQASAFDDALNKALTFGVTQTTAAIASKGWDSAEVKSAVVGTAVNKLIDRFPRGSERRRPNHGPYRPAQPSGDSRSPHAGAAWCVCRGGCEPCHAA